MPILQTAFLSVAALASLFFGIRYLFTKEFMPYHAVVAGHAWSELDVGLQTIILGMLRIVGGGLTTYGLALLWLLIPLGQHAPWAAWAVISITVTSVLPTLYVTVWLRRFAPAARTPVVPAVAVFALALLGSVPSFFR